MYKAECEVVAKEGITILGFAEPWNGRKTKLICNCEKHGKWKTTSIRNFKEGRSCPQCGRESSPCKLDSTVVVDTLEKLCQESGYKFLGIDGEYKNVNSTKVKYECPKHGIKSAVIARFKGGRGCGDCARDNFRGFVLKEDATHIKDFMKTGKFLEGTTFTRSLRKNSLGWPVFWNYTCPKCSHDEYVQAGVCSGVFEGAMGHLKKGNLCCRCSYNCRHTKEQWEYRIKKQCLLKGYTFLGWVGLWGSGKKFNYSCPLHGQQSMTPRNLIEGYGCPACAGKNQQECYINSIWDENILRGIKFGISVNSVKRLKGQNNKNLFQMQQMKVYLFPDVNSCKRAEKACLKRLQCGIVSSVELRDGYSETTPLSNLEAIEEIFKEFGGVLKPREEECKKN